MGLSYWRKKIGRFRVALLWRLVPPQLLSVIGAATGRISFSQHGEDEVVLRQLERFRGVERVITVEVGAFNGIRYSPTLRIEQSLPSQSLLVEASTKSALSCRKNRPKAIVLCAAVGRSSEIEFFKGNRAVSGLASRFSTNYLEKWNLSSAEQFPVPVVTMELILAALAIKKVHFLSIDVQGAELDVLEGINWTHRIDIISIELEGADLEREESCRDILRNHGFRFRLRLGPNELWSHPSFAWIPGNEPESRPLKRLTPYAT